MLPEMNFASRVNALRELAELRSGDMFYVSALANIRYLSGFTGSAGLLLVGYDSAYLLVDGRYEEIANSQCEASSVEVIGIESAARDEQVGALLRGAKRLFIDPYQVCVADYWSLKEIDGGLDIEHRRALPERLRLTKDQGEIARIRAACRIANRAFSDIVETLSSEPTERAFANHLESRMKELGADDIGFPSIVASGPNSLKPHAQPGSRVIREGEPVIVDFGAVVDGYHSDTTRTVWFGDLPADIKAVYEAARYAHDAEVAAIRPGVSHAEIDAAGRKAMVERGYDRKPLHPSGHSLGLDIHERPFLNPSSEDPVLEGYVIAVEPGLYIPGLAGCRIENTYYISDKGPELLL